MDGRPIMQAMSAASSPTASTRILGSSNMTNPTFGDASRQDNRQMNRALLRVAGVAALSVLFALIECTAQIGEAPQYALPSSAIDAMTARATSLAPTEPFDLRSAEAQARRDRL
jgi:hypothetical protein